MQNPFILKSGLMKNWALRLFQELKSREKLTQNVGF